METIAEAMLELTLMEDALDVVFGRDLVRHVMEADALAKDHDRMVGVIDAEGDVVVDLLG